MNGNQDRPTRPVALVVEDDPFSRQMLVGTLAALGFEALAAANLDEADAIAKRRPLTAAVIDLNLGQNQSGLDVADHLLSQQGSVAIVILSAMPSPELAGEPRSRLSNQMTYVVKSDIEHPTDLLAAIRRVQQGQSSSRSAVAGRIVVRQSQARLLQQMAAGDSNRQIATARGVSVRAIEVQVARLFRTLGLSRDGEKSPRVMAVKWFNEGRITVRSPRTPASDR